VWVKDETNKDGDDDGSEDKNDEDKVGGGNLMGLKTH